MTTITKRIIAVSLFFITLSVEAANPSFSRSKYLLQKEVYHDHLITFYANCDYVAEMVEGRRKPILKPQWDSCGFTPRKQAKRAARVEWEHVMPAHRLGKHMSCWRSGGRRNCSKVPAFRLREADMQNLVPTIGEINGDRSNLRFAIIPGEERVYGTVDFEVDVKNRIVEPTPIRRGDIARIYFYMAEKYNVELTSSEQKMFGEWDKADPVSDWEKIRNRRIYAIQGDYNRFVEVLSE